MISKSIGFSIHIVIIGIMSLNVGSNIVLNSVVQLEAVLHTECYFTDTALKARLLSFYLMSFLESSFGQESKPHIPG